VSYHHPLPSTRVGAKTLNITFTLWIVLLLLLLLLEMVVPKAIPIHTHPAWWPFQYPEIITVCVMILR
jgi:uncharacterized integral membrane protein